MNIQLTGYQIESVMQALQDSDTLWEARIEQAERGDAPKPQHRGSPYDAG